MDAPHTHSRKPSFAVRLRRTSRRLGFLALLTVVALVALKYWGYDKLDDEVRSRVEERLREHFPHLIVKVQSARRVQGKGIEIRGIGLSLPGAGKRIVLAYVDEILADCDTHFPDFVTHTPEIRRLRVRGLKVKAQRNESGSWNLAQLLPVNRGMPFEYPPVSIENAELEIADSQRDVLTLRKINVTVQPKASAERSGSGARALVLQVRGTLAGDHLDRVEIAGTVDPVSKAWELRGAVEGLEFNPRLRNALPREAGQALAPLASIRGRTHFGFRVASRRPAGARAGAQPALEFEANGQISEGRVDDARLPDPLTEVAATIHCDNDSLRIDDLSARCGQAIIESFSAELHGLSLASPLTVTLSAKQVALERLRRESFPASVRDAWNRFSPRGTINLEGTLHFDGRQWHPQLTADCLDLSVMYEPFQYRVTDGVGTIRLDYDHLTADVRFLAGAQTVRCTCDVWQPGPAFTGSVDVLALEPLLIDDKMLKALQPKWRSVVQSFHPRGNINFSAKFSRERPDDVVHRRVHIDLRELTVQYDKFFYQIDQVTGALKLEDSRWTFENLAGRNGSAQIAGSGKWLPGPDREGNQLHLDFVAASVPLDDELRQALAPGTQRLWSNLRPRGTLDDVRVGLKYNPTLGRMSVNVDARKRERSPVSPISIEPTWFRYRLDDLTGDFSYDSATGLATLTDVRGRHDKTVIQAAGTSRLQADGGCSIRFSKLAADRIRPDHELLSALPGGIGPGLARLDLTGQYNMEGELAVAVPARDGPPTADWNLRFVVENGSLVAGTPVEHIYGQVQLTGQSDGKTAFSLGRLDVDSAMIRGVQFVNVRGPLWIDQRRLLAGAWAQRQHQAGAPQWVTAEVVGGQLSLDGELVFADGKFQLYTTLENADLTRVVQQLCPAQRNLTGKAFGVIELGGTTQGVHTWRGQGQVRLEDADIYELPLMVSMLSLLTIKRPDRTAFTTSNMDFRIEGDDVEFTQIDFEGDAISLKGKGWMNSRHDVDLKFYTQLGRDEMQLPFFRPLMGEINKQFMLIEVTGPLDHPHVSKTLVPQLNEQIAQMFPELAARTEASRAQDQGRGPLWGPRKLLQPGVLWPRKE